MTDIVDMQGRPADRQDGGEKKANEKLCTMLEGLLREARSGNLIAVAFVTGHWNGDTTAGIAGDFNMTMVGEAHTLAHTMSAQIIGLHEYEDI